MKTHTYTLPPETAEAVKLFSTKFFPFQLQAQLRGLSG